MVTAMDITHDPAHGVDTYKLFDHLQQARDLRIKYVISNGRIFNTQVLPWQVRPYHGANKHDRHIHISVRPQKSLYDLEAPWALGDFIPGAMSKHINTNIVATVFGGEEEPQTSAYTGKQLLGGHYVALPWHFEGDRPRVKVSNAATGVSSIASIEDVGPWNTNDPYWQQPNGRPQAETGTDMKGRPTNHAGIDLSPDLAKLLGINGKGRVNWTFE